MKLSKQEAAILRTVVYFDLFSYPLTELEIWKWQYHGEAQSAKRSFDKLGIPSEVEGKAQSFELNEIVEVLEKSEALKNELKFKDGFYFLNGREEIVEERKRRQKISDQKIKRVKFWARFLRRLPFVKAIAVCNNLGYRNAGERSDIDLLVITEPGRIWTARFFLTGFLKFFLLRPGDRENYDGLCPSFFISAADLNTERFAIKNGDPYLNFWTNNVMPLAGCKKYFEKFYADNEWIKKFLPASLAPVGHPRLHFNGECLFQETVERILIVFPFTEKALKTIQMRILPENLKKLANHGSGGVFVSDEVLKFHENDRRSFFKEKFEQKFNDVVKMINYD